MNNGAVCITVIVVIGVGKNAKRRTWFFLLGQVDGDCSFACPWNHLFQTNLECGSEHLWYYPAVFDWRGNSVCLEHTDAWD